MKFTTPKKGALNIRWLLGYLVLDGGYPGCCLFLFFYFPLFVAFRLRLSGRGCDAKSCFCELVKGAETMRGEFRSSCSLEVQQYSSFIRGNIGIVASSCLGVFLNFLYKGEYREHCLFFFWGSGGRGGGVLNSK